MERISKKTLISGGILILIILVGIVSYIFSLNNKVQKWNDKIYSGINVYGINIGGLNKDEATKILNENLSSLIMDKKLKVVVGDKELELSYELLKPTYNIEVIVQEALDYGKNEGIFTKNSLINGKEEINLEGSIAYDEEALTSFEDKVVKEVSSEGKNASISIDSGNIVITKEENKKTIDKEELHRKLLENINGDPEDEVEITLELKEEEVKIKAEDLNKITGKISSYSTNYIDTGDGRIRNMEIAAGVISGTIVMPGEEFSYNALIGDTTPDKGYEKANTYVGNKIVPDYGGGICQVSTTLYRAVMNANIKSTERMNHSLIVSYAEPGLDATVANPHVDYKFVNTYDFPIYIEGDVGGGVVSFSIYGNVESMGSKTYSLVSVVHEKYNPEVKYEDDETMEEGTEKVSVYGMPGYKASSYLVTYENGVEVNRELIATDTYLKTDTIIKKGTKKKEVENQENSEENKKPTNAEGNKVE